MKTLALPLVCMSLILPALPALADQSDPSGQADKAIPLDNFKLRMSFNGKAAGDAPRTYIELTGSLTAGDDKPEFDVSYLCRNVTNTKDGETTSYFPLTQEDVRTLIRVSAAAQKESPMKVEVDYNHPVWKTSYESLEKDGEWKILMKREHWVAEFAANEGDHLGGLLDECMSSIAWYEKLFTADKLPEPMDGARPPSMVDDMTLTASFGEVSLGDFGYRSDFSYGANERIPANTHHELAVHYLHQGPQKFKGPWVRDLMVKTGEAAEAAQKLEGYSFRARKKEMTYEITAMPDLKQAQVRLHSDLGPNSFMAPTSKVDQGKAAEVAAVVRRAEAFETWFAEHHELLAANQR